MTSYRRGKAVTTNKMVLQGDQCSRIRRNRPRLFEVFEGVALMNKEIDLQAMTEYTNQCAYPCSCSDEARGCYVPKTVEESHRKYTICSLPFRLSV